MEMDLFSHKAKERAGQAAPLADRMRPTDLSEVVGQRDLVGEGSMLRTLIDGDAVPSMIFWGPPGTGKTTLARVIARMTESRFISLSAVTCGVAELRTIVAEAKDRLGMHGTRTIVFIDEIHRWNKAQQDAFLPHVEDGTVTLIGATTENPSFEVNAALLSRCKVFVLDRLSAEDIERLVVRAAEDPDRGYGRSGLKMEDGVPGLIAGVADGDARSALNLLEMAVGTVRRGKMSVDGDDAGVVQLSRSAIVTMLKRSHLRYDKGGEEHYNCISALHKSMRGSDADASLYWLGRMLEAGEDPLYVARRLVRFASEDIGLADPDALLQANAAYDAAHRLGMPECEVHLAQAAVYLARAPKSTALYAAYGRVKDDVRKTQNDPVPLHLRNAPTALMKELGYGKDYIYPPAAGTRVRQEYLPERLKGRKYLPGTGEKEVAS